MTEAEFNSDELTDEQREAMKNLHERSGIPWEEFRDSARVVGSMSQPYVAIPDFHGMYVGIETDGYTHS